MTNIQALLAAAESNTPPSLYTKANGLGSSPTGC